MDYTKLKEKWAAEALQKKQFSEQLKKKFLSKGISVLKRFGVQKAVLFGSLQHGRCGYHSDIDLLVLPLASTQYWHFRHELEKALEFPVDVYTETDDPVFVEKMIERGEMIYEVQP